MKCVLGYSLMIVLVSFLPVVVCGQDAEKAETKKPGKTKTEKARMGSSDAFYAIVIGRLKSKDLELGGFMLDVDYVTSIYGDRRLKDSVIGKTARVTGVAGPWIDKLLLIKVGQTLKFRSGTLVGDTFTLSPKATVLEQAAPFNVDSYPIPPEGFRGFQGVLLGVIESKSDQGYDMTIRVSKVLNVGGNSTASEPDSIAGRLVDLQGFFASEYRGIFDALRIGDTIRIQAAHRVPEIDALEVAGKLEKVEKK